MGSREASSGAQSESATNGEQATTAGLPVLLPIVRLADPVALCTASAMREDGAYHDPDAGTQYAGTVHILPGLRRPSWVKYVKSGKGDEEQRPKLSPEGAKIQRRKERKARKAYNRRNGIHGMVDALQKIGGPDEEPTPTAA